MTAKKLTLFGVAALLTVTLGFFLRQGGAGKRAEEEQMVAGATFAMDTVIEQKWFGPAAQETYDEVVALLESVEADISQHRPDSEISRLNAAAGKEPVEVSERTYSLLKRAQELCQGSGGAFDITLAPLVNLWGITGPSPTVPTEEAVAQGLALSGFAELVLEDETRTAYLPREGMGVDLGGIAKGWTADLVREVALGNGIQRGYASLGGNLVVIGDKPDGTPFKFGVRDPRGPASTYIGVLTLPGKTMATTGDYERFFEVDGVRYHHVLDPRTGYPARGGLISVSVITADGALADFLSTALFVQGKEAALGELENPDFALIVVDSDKNIYLSKSLGDAFTFHEGIPGYHLVGP